MYEVFDKLGMFLQEYINDEFGSFMLKSSFSFKQFYEYFQTWKINFKKRIKITVCINLVFEFFIYGSYLVQILP